MDIQVIASGSSGNCYRISDGKTALLLECGIPFRQLQQALNFKVRDIQGCLVTHEHKDHCKAIMDLIKASTNIYVSAGTKESLQLDDNHRLKTVKAMQQFDIGSWLILPFDTVHDAKEPLGYLLYSQETKEKLLFATDTYYIKYRFTGLTHIMVECNYSMENLNGNIYDGIVDEKRKARLLKSHFELNNCIGFLKANDLSKVKEIYLLHLSNDNGDAENFKNKVMAATGLPVYIAGKRDVITWGTES